MGRKKSIDVIRQNGVFMCLKMGRHFYCVAHDPETGKTWGFVPPDRRLREYQVTDLPFGEAAINRVAKGRKRKTAIVYFNEAMKKLRRENEINEENMKCQC